MDMDMDRKRTMIQVIFREKEAVDCMSVMVMSVGAVYCSSVGCFKGVR